MRERIDIAIGQRFNKLIVIKELPIGSNGRVLRCQCDCGNIKDILLPHLIRSKIKSCGCHRRQMATKHGMWESREYSTWENMIQRCTNSKARKYHLYGGRGITICEKWLKSFQGFYEDMGSRPDNTTLDRLDGDKGYHKENCKWSTPREQAVNIRIFHHRIKHNDVVKTIEEWLIELNVDRNIFKSRITRGLGFKVALLGNVDIITLDVINKQQIIYHLHEFLSVFGFEREKVLKLIDCDHEEPYCGYLLRHLVGFQGWPCGYI